MSERILPAVSSRDEPFAGVSDRELVDAVCAGYDGALEELLVNRCGGLLKAIALAFRFEEDLTQEVAVRLYGNGDWARLRNWNGEAALSSYIGQVARRICLSRFRERASRNDRFERLFAEDDLPAGNTTDVVAAVLFQERRSRVLAAIERLPPHERDAILSNVFEETPLYEFARTKGISPDNARQIKRRAVQRLRAMLTEGSDDD